MGVMRPPGGNKNEGYNAYHGVSPVDEKSELFIKRDINGRTEKTQKEARMLRELLRLDYEETSFSGPFPQQIKYLLQEGSLLEGQGEPRSPGRPL